MRPPAISGPATLDPGNPLCDAQTRGRYSGPDDSRVAVAGAVGVAPSCGVPVPAPDVGVFSTGVAIALESGMEAAQALDRALASGDLSRRALRGFERRQHQRYRAFRRFVLAFYTRGFRDLFFQPVPLPPVFRAVVTSLAGYWRPSWRSRAWQRFFFALARVQERIPLAPRIPEVGTGSVRRYQTTTSGT